MANNNMKNFNTNIELYKKMLFIRAVEEKIAKDYHPETGEQQMRCPFIYQLDKKHLQSEFVII